MKHPTLRITIPKQSVHYIPLTPSTSSTFSAVYTPYPTRSDNVFDNDSINETPTPLAPPECFLRKCVENGLSNLERPNWWVIFGSMISIIVPIMIMAIAPSTEYFTHFPQVVFPYLYISYMFYYGYIQYKYFTTPTYSPYSVLILIVEILLVLGEILWLITTYSNHPNTMCLSYCGLKLVLILICKVCIVNLRSTCIIIGGDVGCMVWSILNACHRVVIIGLVTRQITI